MRAAEERSSLSRESRVSKPSSVYNIRCSVCTYIYTRLFIRYCEDLYFETRWLEPDSLSAWLNKRKGWKNKSIYGKKERKRERERERVAEAIIENVVDETVARQQRATVRYIYDRITTYGSIGALGFPFLLFDSGSKPSLMESHPVPRFIERKRIKLTQ